MPDDSNPSILSESCPACTVLMDVSGLEPWAAVVCPACGETVRVRTAFHHFTLTREVGLGGMSRVFGARDQSLGRDLALKILNPGLSQDEKRLRQFEKEAQITASISHPNVVKVYTAGRDQGYFFMAMELVEGGSLDDRIRKEGRQPEAWVLELAEQVVQGLKEAGAAGLIHRDIKPGNILLSGEGTPKIVDFGLAIFARDGVEDTEIWATPYYVPPETLHGEPEDFRSDIYALGATLYHALMGKPLFDSDSNSLAELKALKSKPADLREAAGALSQETVAILNRALKRRPSERYHSYDEFLDHLRYARRRLRRGGRGAPWPGRQGITPWQWAGLTAAVALAGGIWMALSNGGDADPTGKNGSLTTDLDPTLGTDTNISSQFLAAREVLFSGDFATARNQFKALAAQPSIRQPTLNWARYHAGMAALLSGDIEGAKEEYAAIANAGMFSNLPADEPAALFFLRSAAAMQSREPVPASHAADCPPNSAQSIGLLAAGLKNWHLGDIAGAVTFLSAFASASPPRSAAWVERYKQLAAPWLNDAKLLASMPPFPDANATPESATAALEQARSLIGNLTMAAHGPAKAAVENQLNRFTEAVNEILLSHRLAEEGELAVKTSQELDSMAAVEASAVPLGLRLAFSEGASRLRQCKAETPKGKEILADRIRWWENADSFLDVMEHDLSNPIEGRIDRYQAPPLRGLISGVPGGLRIKPASGPDVEVPFPSCAPASLAALGERLLERIPDSDQYYRRRELLVAFALRSGLKTYAAVAGRELAREHPAFRARWARLNELP